MKLRKMTYTADGERRLSEKWYAVWLAFDGQLRRLALFADKKASAEAARQIDKLNSIRASGDVLSPELSRFVEGLPSGIRDRLAGWDIIALSRMAGSKALSEHIADWRAGLLAKGNTSKDAELVTGRARRLFKAAGARFWTDINAGRVQQQLAEMRKDKASPDGSTRRGISIQTTNFYLAAGKGFCRWMVRERRASESPVAYLQALNVKVDRRHDRRALSADELRWLLDTTEHGPERFGMPGAERSLLYRLALETGLRVGELQSLTPQNFHLSGGEPSVTIQAAYAKNRRADTLPLRPDTAELLKAHLAGKLPTAAAFRVPRNTYTAQMLRLDLLDARTAWLADATTPEQRAEREASDFLAYVDASGKYADFHGGTRHTFISNLAAGGVHPKLAQDLARHSDINLTLSRYTHTLMGERADALAKLPDLSAPVRQTVKATGTDDAIPVWGIASLSPSLSLGGETQRSSVDSGGLKGQNGDIDERPVNIGESQRSQGFSQPMAVGLTHCSGGRANRS